MHTIPEDPTTPHFAASSDEQLGHLLEQHILEQEHMCAVGHRGPQAALVREVIRRLRESATLSPLEQCGAAL